MNKRALYVVGQLGVGGHVRSALTYASELRTRGWSVSFCGSDAGGAGLVAEQGFSLIRVESLMRGEFFATASAVAEAVRWAPDVVHSFDLGSLPFAAAVSARARARAVHTICGGKAPWYPIPAWDGLVVMSEELSDALYSRSGYRPRIVRGRLRLEERRATLSKAEVRRRMNIDEHESVALMVSRLCRTKEGSLRSFIDIVAALARRDASRTWRGVICGSADDERVHSDVAALCSVLNATSGRTVVAVDATFCAHGFQALPAADVFMGVGDAFAEAAINRIPALVVGEAGYAGMLSPETEAELYRFNLSGRNSAAAETAEQTADRIIALLDGAPDAEVEFAHASVVANLGVAAAADVYEQLYSSGVAERMLPPRTRLTLLRSLLGIRKRYLRWVPTAMRQAVLRARGA